VIFEDFTIPMFNEAKELVLKTASYMPGLRLVGWDVAIGENGPVIIEGNSDYEIRGSDFAYGGYLTNKTFRKVLDEIHYSYKESSSLQV
jgi:glutathione synthase/RimK-type ligase-like ATP-grasp enzyme